MIKAVKYELNPNITQKHLLHKMFGDVRFVYNWALDLKLKIYSNNGNQISCFELSKQLTQLKKQEEYKWLKKSNSQSLQQALSNLDDAFTNFYKSKKGFPKFKSKHKSKPSFRIPQSFKIDYNNFKFYIPKIGWVKFYKQNIVDGVFKNATVTMSPTGRYFVSIIYETVDTRKHGVGIVGIDLGIKKFAITSDGTVFENQKYLKSNLNQLKREQRKLQRKYIKGVNIQSINFYKQKLVVAKLHEKIANMRKDTLHKVSNIIATTYEIVCIEDLNIQGLLKNHNLAQSISDMGWGMFRKMLEYKVKDLRVIGRFEPSSQLCSSCGSINKDLKLKDREWSCDGCGTHHDRDHNAAINIKNFGLRASTFGGKIVH